MSGALREFVSLLLVIALIVATFALASILLEVSL